MGHSENNKCCFTEVVLKRSSSRYTVDSLLQSSLNLAFMQRKLHDIFIFEMTNYLWQAAVTIIR